VQQRDLTELTGIVACEIAIADSQDDSKSRSNGASIVLSKRALLENSEKWFQLLKFADI
jgi:hypothetical protein